MQFLWQLKRARKHEFNGLYFNGIAIVDWIAVQAHESCGLMYNYNAECRWLCQRKTLKGILLYLSWNSCLASCFTLISAGAGDPDFHPP